MKISGPTAENLRLQKLLAEKNRRIAVLQQQLADLKDEHRLLRSQLVAAGERIRDLQLSTLDVLVDMDELDTL